MNDRAIALILWFILTGFLLRGQAPAYPFQDPARPLEERVADLVSRLTVEEKVRQLFHQAEAIPRLGIPDYNWWNESLHGVARAGKATVFPQAIGLAAGFDEPLMLRIATAISDEARAKHHFFVANNVRSIYTGLTFWSPNINIFRDPRWGRGQETYGEDTFLTARMAVGFIRGLQGDDPRYLKTVATAKHYAVHSGPEYTRHVDNIFVNDRDLYETYLPAFKAAVQEAKVHSVMCAYNRFRDQPCCGSDLLLSKILRQEFGFEGYVVSDCGAISDFYQKGHHEVVKTPAQAWGWSIASGTDINCEDGKAFLQNNLDSALATGIINERDIDLALSRLFRARFRLGMFDPPAMVPYTQIPMSVVGSEAHLQLALQASEKALVLLKNDGLLPLKKVRTLALIGPNANNPSVLVGNYNGVPIRPVTPLKALQDKLGAKNVLYSQGCPIVPGMYADMSPVGAENLFHEAGGKRVKGLKAFYFANTNFEGQPALERIDPQIDFFWEKTPVGGLLEERFSARWEGVLVPSKSGKYLFGGNLTLSIDGRPVPREGISLEKGKSYALEARLVVNSFWWANAVSPSARLLWVEDRDYTQEALDAARKADVVVFCGGISPDLEGEEMPLQIDGFAHGDRSHLDLPKPQQELLRALKALNKPIVFVNFSGSAVALNWEQEMLPAIVQAFYPGEATGTALSRLLFGEMNPSGRLPVTFYKSVADLPGFLDYRMEGRTYRYFRKEPLYPFGYGLSYTSFAYGPVEIAKQGSTQEPSRVRVSVSNTGALVGEEVVQLYLSALDAPAPVPIRSLVGFKRISLKPGEIQTLEFELKPEQFSIIDQRYRQLVRPGQFRISIGGGQPVAPLKPGQYSEMELSLRGE